MEKTQKIAILGCGWFGFAFAKKLVSLGYEVNGSTTTPEKLALLAEDKIQSFLVNFTSDQVIVDLEFFNADVLFICIPPKRSSAEVYDYVQKIASILEAAKDRVSKIVLISSTSVYGDENKTVNELTETNPDTESGKVIVEAENILKAKHPEDFTIIRFGGLIGPNRNPGRFFAGKTDVPNGLAPVNLIHQTDAVNIAVDIIEKQAFGRIYNACSPMHPTRKDFYTAAADKAGLVAPEFIPEKNAWKVIESVNVPKHLNYNFLEEIA